MFEKRPFHKGKKEGYEQQKEASTNRAAGSLLVEISWVLATFYSKCFISY